MYRERGFGQKNPEPGCPGIVPWQCIRFYSLTVALERAGIRV